MRIAIAQINPTLGDFKNNALKILNYIEQAKAKKASLVVFPECSLFGYHPFDLLERRQLVETQLEYLDYIRKKMPTGIHALVGAITLNPAKKGRPYFNSAVLIEKNKKPKLFHKQLLPTGDVFDEARFIEPGNLSKNFFSIGKKKFFVTICEDIWAWPDENGTSSYKENPLTKIKKSRLDLVINLSASPFFMGKKYLRETVVKKTARLFKAPVLYANLVGAQDEIIFDGSSFILDPQGKELLRSYSFVEDLNIFDLEEKSAWHPIRKKSSMEDLHSALVLGIRDFCNKTGLQKIHLGISGGIDSAVVAALAADAIGPRNVVGIAIPGPYSSELSLSLAQQLCENLKIQFKLVDINEMYTTSLLQLKSLFDTSEFGLMNENLQARLRGLVLMAYANKQNSLLLTTGNKSEYATGYATLYGDMCGGLAPIADLTKANVYQVAKFYNQQSELIPNEIIDRAPSAELRPNQKDQDSLPEYNILDQAVEKIVTKCEKASSKTEFWLTQKMIQTEFKRWQAAPILKVTAHSFGRGRRFPIAHKALETK